MTLRTAVVLASMLLVATSVHAQQLPPAPPPLPTPALPTEPPPMPASPGHALTLMQAMELATRDASDPRLAELAVRRAEAAERTALSTLLPQITGQFNYFQ